MKKESVEYVMEHSVTGKQFVVSEENIERLQAVGYLIVEKKDDVPFDPDPPKASSKNSDGTPTSPMSRAKQLAKLAARLRNKKKEEGYVSHAQRKAVWASRNDKKESVEEKYSWNDVNSALTKANYMRGNPAEISKVAKHFDHKSGNDKKFSHGDVKKNLSKAGIDAARHHNVMKHMKESVELEEAHAYAKAANALRDYANKSGGIDKKDFHTAAKHLDNVGKAGLMQKGQHLAKMNDHFRSLDTDVRDRIHMTLKKHGVMESVQVDELKKSTLGSYVKKASQDAASKAYRAAMDANAPSYNQAQRDRSGVNYMKSVKRQKGIAKATDKLTKEAKLDELSPATHDRYQKAAHKSAVQGVAQMRMGTRTPKSMAANQKKRQAGIDTSKFLNRKQHGVKPTYEAKSFDQKFKDHLKFATSKSKAVQDYMAKRKANRDAAHAKQDPSAVKKNYGPAVIPPGTAYNKASKRGMKPTDAASAVSTAFKNKAKRSGKLPG
jgi:hypothetical protein